MTLDKPSFILASASPRRIELLRQIGIAPERCLPAEIDETPLKKELPADYATRMAQAKARKVALAHPGTAVLAADTVVACGRRILPKAEDERTAQKCLTLLSGRRHRVYTALALIDARGALRERLVESQVRFKRLTTPEVEEYLRGGEWQGKAGGYAIQGHAAAFIPWIAGSHSCVMGLPLYETAQLLHAAGIASALVKAA